MGRLSTTECTYLPTYLEGELPDMNAEEIAKEGFYLVKSVI